MVDPHSFSDSRCGHSFCCQCLILHIINTITAPITTASVRCPTCRVFVSIPTPALPHSQQNGGKASSLNTSNDLHTQRQNPIVRQSTLVSLLDSVVKTLKEEGVDGWEGGGVADEDYVRRQRCVEFNMGL